MERLDVNTPAVRRWRPAGFTLLELVIVVAIIATLAGLVIPQFSMMGRSTDMAASAKTQSDLSNNLGTYFVLQKRWPLGMDSLLVGDGGEGSEPTGVFVPVEGADGQQRTGLPDSGPHLDRSLVMVNLADESATVNSDVPKTGFAAMQNSPDRTGFARSLTRGGLEFVYDHDDDAINANDSAKFTAQRPLDRSIGGDGCWVAAVDEDPSNSDAQFLISRLMPNGQVPEDVVLVAMGIGPNNDAISKTMTNPPIYPGAVDYYGRYVAIFKVYANGERPTLVGVVDSYGRTPDYTQQQYNESLPDDARRG